MSEITWAPLIPLIGGFPLGCEKALGRPPVGIYSYPGFEQNDSHYVKYMNEVKKYNVPYIDIREEFKGDIDVIVGTPPCAALSSLNTGTSEKVKGAGCQKNEWMYRVFEDAIDIFNVKAVVVENAPALYTEKGKPVADRLYEIAKSRGYSLTLYKTSTMFHGIPQNRQRTFAIAWRSKNAPLMGWYKRDRKKFAEYLKEVPSDALQQDIIINPKVYKNCYFEYIRHRENRDPRESMLEQGTVSSLQYIMKNYGLKDAHEWFVKTGNEKGAKHSEYTIMKHEKGMGVWDSSTRVYNDVMNAVINRNMSDTIHPSEDRSLTVREALHMMGHPHDFELLNANRNVSHISQNVPSCTARDICLEIKKFIQNELQDSGATYVKQSNFKETIEQVDYERNDLTSFFV